MTPAAQICLAARCELSITDDEWAAIRAGKRGETSALRVRLFVAMRARGLSDKAIGLETRACRTTVGQAIGRAGKVGKSK